MMVGSQNNNTQEDALLKKSVFSMSSFSPIFHWKHMYTVNNPLQSSLGKQPTFREETSGGAKCRVFSQATIDTTKTTKNI